MRKRFGEYALIFLFLAVLVLQLVGSIRKESPTYDEVTYLQAGYGFLHQDFRWDPFNPPFAREIIALPLLINKAFIGDHVVFWPRMVVVFFTLMLAVLVYIFAKKLYGITAGFVALSMLVFEPNILAHGHYATMDLIFSFFFLLTIFLFWLFQRKFTTKRIIFFGIVFGLTLSIKVSALPFLLISLLLYISFRVYNERIRITRTFLHTHTHHLLLFIFVVAISVWSTYFFTFEPVLGYRFDPHRPAIALAKQSPIVHFLLTVPVPLGSYMSTIKQIILYNYSPLYTKNSFFMGILSHNGLPGYYFIPLLFLKMPIPILFLFFFSLYSFRKKLPKSAIILIPIVGIMGNVLFTKVTLVLRYILPVIPLLVIFASQSVTIFPKHRKVVFSFMFLLLGMLVYRTLSFFPHYVTFTNEVISDRQTAYRYISDSNLDWGQSLYSLRNYQKTHDLYSLQFAYFGVVKPDIYGVSYERIKDMNLYDDKDIHPLDISGKKVIAISAMCYYFCGYYTDPMLKKMRLFDTISGSILLFKKQ